MLYVEPQICVYCLVICDNFCSLIQSAKVCCDRRWKRSFSLYFTVAPWYTHARTWTQMLRIQAALIDGV